MISTTLIVKNGERKLKEVLYALRFFNEILLLDTGSTDKTIEIATSFPNVTIRSALFRGFGHAHNLAAAWAKHDWILSIDSDEIVSEELSKEILSLALDPETIYALPFHNYFNGKWIRYCGWYPETHVRLYNKKITSFSEDQVHEKVMEKGLTKKILSHPVIHFPYEGVNDFLIKMERYSSLFALQNQGKKNSSLFKALIHGSWAFIKSFILKWGFLGGYEGFLISVYNGHTAFYKYLKLREANFNSVNHVSYTGSSSS